MNLYDLAGVILALFVVAITYYKWSFTYWSSRKVPTPKPTIPLGNTQNPFNRKTHLFEFLDGFYKKFKAEGHKFFGYYVLSQPKLIPMDVSLIKSILTTDFNHFVNRGIFYNEKDDPLSAHLFSIDSPKWRKLRTKITPTFTSGKMKMMFQTLLHCTIQMEETIEEHCKLNQEIDIKNTLVCFTTDVIGSCAFGIDCNSFKEPDTPFVKYGRKSFTADKNHMFQILVGSTFPELARILHFRPLSKDVTNFFMDIVIKSIKHREENSVKRKDFMQLLVDLKNHENNEEALTVEEIAAQAFIFFLAGFETSSSTITYCLYELARHEKIQQKVRDEINCVLKKYDGEITYEAIKDMKYMGRVIDETLRMYPPVPLLNRICTEDYKIPGSDLVIEKNVALFIPIYSIHHDAEYYQNPDEFNPENFTEEAKSSRPAFTHLPFGEGPRNCIGLRFGLLETKVGLTVLLKKYKYTLNEKTCPPLRMNPNSFTMTAKNDILLNIEKVH